MVKLPSNVNINNLIDYLRIISWEAADILISYEGTLKDLKKREEAINTKSDKSPVTLADLKVNEIILKRMMEEYSNVSWNYLSEENVDLFSKKENQISEWLWILDPLDGTKDFVNGTKDYAMHLALNFQNKPFLGIVLIPKRNELWISDGKKVWCERRNGSFLNSNLSKKTKLEEMNLVRSKNHSNDVLKKLIEKIEFSNISVMGSVGCKISSIIRGENDIYISVSLPGKSSPKDWDFAAPEVILKNSGGAITNIDNEELIYNQENYEQRGIIIASSNKETHKEVCSKIKAIIKKYNLYPLNS